MRPSRAGNEPPARGSKSLSTRRLPANRQAPATAVLSPRDAQEADIPPSWQPNRSPIEGMPAEILGAKNMSQSLNQSWDFTQKGYIKTHGLGGIGASSEGICISLSCRWAKMMLKSKKSLLNEPEVTKEQRTNYFSKGSTPTKIAINQDIFDKEREGTRTEISYAKESKKMAEELFEKGEVSWDEYLILSGNIIGGAKDTHGGVQNSLQKILHSNKLHVVESQSCQSFAEYFLGTKPGACYIFSSSGLEHACAGYVTGGVFSNDYYFFDPNSGEFIASGGSEVAAVMHKFQEHYAKQGHTNSKTDRLRVEYKK